MPHSHKLKFCVAVLCLLLWPFAGWSATWTTDATLTVENTREVTEEGTTREYTFDQSYNLSYETDLLENLQFTLDLTLDIEDTDEVPGWGERVTTPSFEANLVAQWWDLFASWEEARTTNPDPETATTVEVDWEFEAIVEPEYEALPAFKFNIQGGNDDVTDKNVEAVLEYSFLDKVDIMLGVGRETSNVPEPDSDTDVRTIEAEIGLTHGFTQAIQLEADWSMDRDQSLVLTDNGEVLAREDTLANEVQALLEWNILEMLTASIERDVQWDKDLEQDTLEVTDTWTGDLQYDHTFSEALQVTLGYTDEREDAKLVGPNTYSITQDYTAELQFSPFEWLTISPSYDRSDKVQRSKDPETETDKTIDDTYEVTIDYALWGEFMVLALTRTWDFSWEKGVKTKEETSWDVELDFQPLYLPGLEISPQYGFTRDVDEIASTTDKEETADVDITYEISVNDRIVLTLDHTYSRTQSWPSDAKMTIERTDDTDLTLSLTEFLRGMSSELSMSRSASDTSGDDKGSEIDYTYSATYDWEFLANYSISFEFNQDVKQESEDTRDFTTTFSAQIFDGRITVDFEHEFEEQLEGEKNENHRYLIEVSGEF